MTEDLAALLENEDEDALFARIQEESLRHYREVELPRRALESKDEDACDSDIFVAPHNASSRSEADQQLFYEGSEAGASGFHLAAGSSYIYPSNYPVRDYQVNIVRSALFHNTLVSLPTGLGKTFIAAVVMYNYYRWFPQGKVVFMAPTRPLVSQQIRACHDIMAIPAEDTIEMTGTLNPNDRIQFWKTKRVFFLTPQILANDLRNKVCPALQFKCVVVDEAHRATKEYAYCQVIRALEEFGAVFRVLALSATPGSNFKAVQEVVENLHIAKLEIRDESSIDVAPYTHNKNIEPIIVKLTGHIDRVKEEFLSIFDRYVRNLKDARLVTGNVNNLTKFQLLKWSEKIKTRIPQGMTKQKVGYLMSDFAVSMSLAHALELLQIYGLHAFHHYLSSGDDDVKVKGAMTRLKQDAQLQQLLQTVQQYLSSENGTPVWSHPKLEHLVRVLNQHFSAAQDSVTCSKVIIFCQYRVVVSEVYNILKSSEPLIKPVMFIGQSSGNGKGGLPQKKQMEVMRNFRNGETNVLIATCVAEEGLDIGAVDLIILMEAHRSPVRFVQRLGRTGRHRSGRCVVLLTSGKEVQKFNDAMATRKSYTRNILQNPNLVESLNENDPRMLPPNLPNPTQQLVHIRVRDDTSAGGKYKKQSDIRQAFSKKGTSKKSAESSTVLNSDQLAEIKDEFQTLELNFNTVPAVGKTYLWQRMMDSPMGCEELFSATFNQLSEFNDWNSSLFPTFVLSHSADSNMLSDLLQLGDQIRDVDPIRADINTQFVRETVKSNENLNKKRSKKNKNNTANKKKKQDKQAPSCSMDIRDCMAVVSQKIKLSQDVSPKDNGHVNSEEPDVIDLISENEEVIELDDDIVIYADKELYDAINHLHSLVQNNRVDVNSVNNRVFKELSCTQTKCPKFLASFDFPDIEDSDITQEKIKNLNVENMFTSAVDIDLACEEYKINTDELLSKYEVGNYSVDQLLSSCINSYNNVNKPPFSIKVDDKTTSNKTKDNINSVLTTHPDLEPKFKTTSKTSNVLVPEDSNKCSKMSASDNNRKCIRHEYTASLVSTVNNKQEHKLKFTESSTDTSNSLMQNEQKERITELKKIEEKSKRLFEEDDEIIVIENVTSPILSGKTTCRKLPNSKQFSENNKDSVSPVLRCGTRYSENENSYCKNVHFNGKRIYNDKISPILSSRKKNMRKYENRTEHSTSPVLTNRKSIQRNGSENDETEYSASPVLTNRMSVGLKNCSLQDSKTQYIRYESGDTENSTSPILSGTTRCIKRQTTLKKNLFNSQSGSGLHLAPASHKNKNNSLQINSSFVSDKSTAECHVKNTCEIANKFSHENQRNLRSLSSPQISADQFKDNKMQSLPVSDSSGECSPEIVGIDDLFDDVDNSDDELNKNIVGVEKETKETEFNKVSKKSNSNAESENEFTFNFDDLFDDDIDGNFSLPETANKGIQDNNAILNQNIKQSCTSPIIVSKWIKSQSTPRPRVNGFFNNSKLHTNSKKLSVIESGSETESDIVGSPILKVMQGTSNAVSRCSTPLRNFSSQFHNQKAGQSSNYTAQESSCPVEKENSITDTKRVENFDYFELDGEDEDNWSFSQLFDENKTEEENDNTSESMYTISQLVAKSSGLPTPKPSKSSQQQEKSGPEVNSKILAKQEENIFASRNGESLSHEIHLVSGKISEKVIKKEMSVSEEKSNKNSENPSVSRYSNIFKFDSDDDLFEGIDSNVMSTSGATRTSSAVNQECVNKATSIDKFGKNNINEQHCNSQMKASESKDSSFNGCIKKAGLSESPSMLYKENIYDEKENFYSRKNISFSVSKVDKKSTVLNTRKTTDCDSNKLQNSFHYDIPHKRGDNFIPCMDAKSPLKNCNRLGNYYNGCEAKPVLSSGWITTKGVSALKRARIDTDFTSDDSDASGVFVNIRQNGTKEEGTRNVKKKIKKKPVNANVIINLANEFVEREAEVSVNRTISSDEENTSGLDDLDEIFIDDLTQRPTTAADQSSINMHAKYLQSIKSPACGRFKIPALSDTALQMDVYSQMVDEDGSYMNDSFCVDETEIPDEAEPSVLEIAEQMLEDRRRGKKKRKRIHTYSSSSDSEREEELLRSRNDVKKNESTHLDENSVIVNRRRRRKRVPTVLSESESDVETANHKHLNSSGPISKKNISEHSKICGEASDNSSSVSSENKSSEIFYKPTLSKLLKSKLKH